MDKSSWLRDIAFYIFSGFVVMLYGYIGYVNFWMSLIFFGIYIV